MKHTKAAKSPERMKLIRNILLLLFAPTGILSVFAKELCCLCDDCEDLPVNKEFTLVNSNGVAVACSEVAFRLLVESEVGADRGVCFAAQDAHSESCCNADSAPPQLEMSTEPVGFGLRAAAAASRRGLWTTATTTGSWNYNSAPGTATAESPSSSNNSGAKKCSLCHDRSYPKNPTGGAAVSFSSFSFTGTCADLYTQTQTLSDTHPLCNPLQDAFDWSCGCNPDYKKTEGSGNTAGDWSW